jgi:TPR repeat protein
MRSPIILAAVLIALGFPISSQAADCLSRATKNVEKGHTQDAINALEKGAHQGDERCQFVLAIWSLTGRDMPPDPESGAKWLKAAAKDGLPIAQAYLGILYASGVGVEQDDSAAAEWYRKAAEYGVPLGQAAYGAVLFLGSGVEKKALDGYVWTSLAAVQGNEEAQSFIAAMEQDLTDEELAEAQIRIAEFNPKKIPNGTPWRPSRLLDDPRNYSRRGELRRPRGRAASGPSPPRF